MAWVEKDLKDHLVSTPLPRARSPTTRLSCPELHPALPCFHGWGIHNLFRNFSYFPIKLRKHGKLLELLDYLFIYLQVNMFTNQGTVIHFNNPKVQASLAANTFTITGHAETKQLTEMLPSILNQLGADSFSSLRRLAEALPKQCKLKLECIIMLAADMGLFI